jgi:hypothetical protein
MAVSRSGEAGVATGDTADADRARLHQLGYKQELKRGLSYVRLCFSVCLTVIRLITLCSV